MYPPPPPHPDLRSRIKGHVVSADGIKPDPTKCEAIKATLPPENVSDLRSFLGTRGYVAKFIPNYANIVEFLTKLTRNEEKGHGKRNEEKGHGKRNEERHSKL